MPDPSPGGVVYLLNSIDSLQVEKGDVIIAGVCSEVVRSAHQSR
jgi:hypothetical protein